MKFVSWKATPSAAKPLGRAGAPRIGAMIRPTVAAEPFM